MIVLHPHAFLTRLEIPAAKYWHFHALNNPASAAARELQLLYRLLGAGHIKVEDAEAFWARIKALKKELFVRERQRLRLLKARILERWHKDAEFVEAEFEAVLKEIAEHESYLDHLKFESDAKVRIAAMADLASASTKAIDAVIKNLGSELLVSKAAMKELAGYITDFAETYQKTYMRAVDNLSIKGKRILVPDMDAASLAQLSVEMHAHRESLAESLSGPEGISNIEKRASLVAEVEAKVPYLNNMRAWARRHMHLRPMVSEFQDRATQLKKELPQLKNLSSEARLQKLQGLSQQLSSAQCACLRRALEAQPQAQARYPGLLDAIQRLTETEDGLNRILVSTQSVDQTERDRALQAYEAALENLVNMEVGAGLALEPTEAPAPKPKRRSSVDDWTGQAARVSEALASDKPEKPAASFQEKAHALLELHFSKTYLEEVLDTLKDDHTPDDEKSQLIKDIPALIQAERNLNILLEKTHAAEEKMDNRLSPQRPAPPKPTPEQQSEALRVYKEKLEAVSKGIAAKKDDLSVMAPGNPTLVNAIVRNVADQMMAGLGLAQIKLGPQVDARVSQVPIKPAPPRPGANARTEADPNLAVDPEADASLTKRAAGLFNPFSMRPPKPRP